MTSAKQDFQRRLEAELRESDAKVAGLKAKAKGANAEIRAQFEIELETLAGTRALAQEKLQEVRRHGEWAWEDLRDDAEKTWNELRDLIERSASLFE
jgi:predicted  nucleic acid-binding Zn-ribbon protein